MKDITLPERKKRKLTKSDWLGIIVGFSIAYIIFQLGNFGFLPAFLIATVCYWIVKKIADKKNAKNKRNKS